LKAYLFDFPQPVSLDGLTVDDAPQLTTVNQQSRATCERGLIAEEDQQVKPGELSPVIA
jgi:hypothetical protein